jgi:pyridoxine 5'-phosphate synthase PdxJ
MKKTIAVFTITAFMGAAVAGPVPKEQLNQREIARLAQTQSQSQHVLQVQAGHWVDDYGVVVVVGIIAAAALAIGIVALAD